MKFHDAFAAEDVQEGQPRLVELLGVSLLVFQLADSYYTIENACTHDDVPLDDGTCEGGEIECPAHGARFDIKTGAALCPPAFEDLRTFETRLEAGRIQIRI